MTQPFSYTAQYQEQGYTIVRDVLDAELIAEAREHVTWLMAKHPDLRPENLHDQLMTRDAFWVRLISDDRLLDVAEQFIGPDIALFASHHIAKPPFTGQKVLWHQDGTGWPLEPVEVITFWLALDDSTPENGCLRVLPGTQRRRLLGVDEIERHNDGENVLGWGMNPADIDETQAVDLILKPGDISIHDPKIVHGSNANTSPNWRRGLTIRYIPTTTRILTAGDEPFKSAFFLRGEPRPEINRYNPWPRYTGDPRYSMPFDDAEAWNARCDAHNQVVGA